MSIQSLTTSSAQVGNSSSQDNVSDLLSSLGDRVHQALEKNSPNAGQASEEVNPQMVAQFFNTAGQQCNSVV